MVSKNESKELFLALFMVSMIIFMMILTTIIWLVLPRFNFISYSGNIALYSLRIVFLVLSLFISLLFLSVYYKKKIPVIHFLLETIIRLSYSDIIRIGYFLNIPENIINAAFIDINNNIIDRENKKYKKNEILLLTSQYYQKKDCDIRISNNINNCKNCIQCDIGKLYKYAEENDFDIKIMCDEYFIMKQITNYKLIIAITSLDEIIQIMKKNDSVKIYGINEKSENSIEDNLESTLSKLLKKNE